MLSKNLLKKTIFKYDEFIKNITIHPRDIDIFTMKHKVIVLLGPRKAGKSYLLYDSYKKVERPLLSNFDDLQLDEFRAKDFALLEDIGYEIYEQKPTMLFDEIQNVSDWDRGIKSLVERGYEICVTGSNAKLLSKDIYTGLRGKAIALLVMPISFKEYLRFKNISLDNNWEYKKDRFIVKKRFNEFFEIGGFPEVVLADDDLKKHSLIQSYFSSVIFKDIIERLGFKNYALVEYLIKRIVNMYGNILATTKIIKDLKSMNISFRYEDLYLLLKALEDIFFAFFVRQYHKSFKKTRISKSKVYIIDNGYISCIAHENDYGRMLENLVFIELFRRENTIENKNIFYWQNEKKQECDFVVENKGRITKAIQVTYELNEQNKDREIKGLLEAMKHFKLKEGLLLTYDQEDEMEVDKKKIIVKPVWKWLLE